MYIVHERKANQWDFETVGRRFQITSVAAPTLLVLIAMFTLDMRLNGYLSNDNRNHCERITPVLIHFTLNFIPKPLTDVIGAACVVMVAITYLNLVEGCLYFKIFQRVKR